MYRNTDRTMDKYRHTKDRIMDQNMYNKWTEIRTIIWTAIGTRIRTKLRTESVQEYGQYGRK